MGRIFLEHLGGEILFSCGVCKTDLTNNEQIISTKFNGLTGSAVLFKKVVNLTFSDIQERVLLTGRHKVRDAFCKKCNTKLGWFYEFAFEKSEIYKEGCIVLEQALIRQSRGMVERMGD